MSCLLYPAPQSLAAGCRSPPSFLYFPGGREELMSALVVGYCEMLKAGLRWAFDLAWQGSSDVLGGCGVPAFALGTLLSAALGLPSRCGLCIFPLGGGLPLQTGEPGLGQGLEPGFLWNVAAAAEWVCGGLGQRDPNN